MNAREGYSNPDLTPEIMDRVDKVIAQHKGEPGSLIPVMEACQDIVGYLPVELQDHISKGLNVPGSRVYGVATFYSFFSLFPKGRHTIKVCTGTACYVRGCQRILDRIKEGYHIETGETARDRRFSLEAVRCLGACGLAPVMVVDHETHGRVTSDRVLKILDSCE